MPNQPFDLDQLARDLEPHGGRVWVTYWADDPAQASYLLFTPQDSGLAAACRRRAALHATLLDETR